MYITTNIQKCNLIKSCFGVPYLKQKLDCTYSTKSPLNNTNCDNYDTAVILILTWHYTPLNDSNSVFRFNFLTSQTRLGDHLSNHLTSYKFYCVLHTSLALHTSLRSTIACACPG